MDSLKHLDWTRSQLYLGGYALQFFFHRQITKNKNVSFGFTFLFLYFLFILYDFVF